jgi:hypothetical protein
MLGKQVSALATLQRPKAWPYPIRGYDMSEGICRCGCGKPTPLATRTRPERDQYAGKPLKFLLGHNSHQLPPLIKRFQSRVEKQPNGCWLWTGSRTSDRVYPRFCVGKTKYVLAHRWAYEFYVGPIADALTIDHLCRTPLCVNPEHLEPVTNVENVMRGDGACSRNAQKTHCKRGHALAQQNVYSYRSKNGRAKRQCKTCSKEAYR